MNVHALKSGPQSIHPLGSLPREVRSRLVAIGRDDLDRLISYHLGGRERVWCYDYDSIMFVLWWDPEHSVYPTPKKYT